MRDITREEARVSFNLIHKNYYCPDTKINNVKHLEIVRDYFNQEPQASEIERVKKQIKEETNEHHERKS